MSECVVLNADGTLTPTGQPVEACAGYVLVSSSEHATMTVIETLFDWPEPEIAQSWFIGAFAFVLGCNVLASIVGSVVSSISSSRS